MRNNPGVAAGSRFGYAPSDAFEGENGIEGHSEMAIDRGRCRGGSKIFGKGGAPAVISSMLSVVALHTIIAPLYFAVQIGLSGAPHPYGMLMKLIGIYVVLTRAMILPIYWLARIFEWPESRFAGLAGPDVTPFVGFIAVPFLTAAFWIVASLIVGGLIGSITLGLMRRNRATSA